MEISKIKKNKTTFFAKRKKKVSLFEEKKTILTKTNDLKILMMKPF